MSEITVKCPSCSNEFPLNDAVLGSVRDHLSQELSSEISEREKKLEVRLTKTREDEHALKEEKQNLADELEKQLAAELKTRTAAITKKASAQAAEEQAVQLKDLQESLTNKTDALKKAQATELALRQERQQLKEDRENLKLEVARQLDAERDKLKEAVAKQEAERQAVRQAELEKKLSDAVKANDDLRRKLEQGSQQTQGEVLELELENRLRATFALDQFSEVPKGIRGADLVHTVFSQLGQPCGTILYETKRTKAWSKDWLAKLKKDLVAAKADIPVLITETLPEGIESSGHLEGVWVCHLSHALPLIHTLRWSLIELSRAKAANEGVQDKQAILYQYFTGPEFRNRLETIVTTFDAMRKTLEQEKKALTKHWAARDKQIDNVVLNLTGMQGDIHGIAGTKLDALEFLDPE